MWSRCAHAHTQAQKFHEEQLVGSLLHFVLFVQDKLELSLKVPAGSHFPGSDATLEHRSGRRCRDCRRLAAFPAPAPLFAENAEGSKSGEGLAAAVSRSKCVTIEFVTPSAAPPGSSALGRKVPPAASPCAPPQTRNHFSREQPCPNVYTSKWGPSEPSPLQASHLTERARQYPARGCFHPGDSFLPRATTMRLTSSPSLPSAVSCADRTTPERRRRGGKENKAGPWAPESRACPSARRHAPPGSPRFRAPRLWPALHRPPPGSSSASSRSAPRAQLPPPRGYRQPCAAGAGFQCSPLARARWLPIVANGQRRRGRRLRVRQPKARRLLTNSPPSAAPALPDAATLAGT